MFNGKKIIFLELLCALFFATACSNADVSENSGQLNTEQSEDSENAGLIEQPSVNLENQEQGVYVTWNEISDAEGYYIYRKAEDGKYQIIATITDNSVVEYLDLEAAAGTAYYYAVRAFKDDQKSDFEEVMIETGIWQPAIKVVYDESEMKITWNRIEGCDGYIVYRKEEGGKYSQLSVIRDVNTTSYVDQDILTGKIYTYAVRSFIGNDKSTYVAVTKATIGQPIVEVNNTAEGMEISWNEIKEAEGYYVYRKKEDGKYEVIQQLSDPKQTSYVDTDFTVGDKYFYAVRSYLGNQKSSFSAVDVTVDLGRVTVTLQAVTSGVRIDWNQIAAADGYYIYKKEESEDGYLLIDTITDASTVSYVDEQVEKGKTYYYFVRAFVGDEEGSYSGSSVTLSGQ